MVLPGSLVVASLLTSSIDIPRSRLIVHVALGIQIARLLGFFDLVHPIVFLLIATPLQSCIFILSKVYLVDIDRLNLFPFPLAALSCRFVHPCDQVLLLLKEVALRLLVTVLDRFDRLFAPREPPIRGHKLPAWQRSIHSVRILLIILRGVLLGCLIDRNALLDHLTRQDCISFLCPKLIEFFLFAMLQVEHVVEASCCDSRTADHFGPVAEARTE